MSKDTIDMLPPLREVIAQHDLRADKSLGQNFLLDSNITDKIVRLSGDLSGVHVFEVGPGPGGLTRSLLKSEARRVSAIEYDSRAVAALQDLKTFADGRLQVIHQDALDVDFLEMVDVPRAIVANLPYNIATPLLLRWLRHIRGDEVAYSGMTLMFQKEVAQRITAHPGSKYYGRLSVISGWLCDADIVYILPPSAFTPPPKVESAVVHFRPKTLERNAPSFKAVETLTAQGFGQRRKMIRQSLKAYRDVLEDCGIDPTLRAENLTIEQYLQIAKRQEG